MPLKAFAMAVLPNSRPPYPGLFPGAPRHPSRPSTGGIPLLLGVLLPLLSGTPAWAAPQLPSPAAVTTTTTAAANQDPMMTMDMDAEMDEAQGGPAPADARDPHAYSDGYTRQSGPYRPVGLPPLTLADEANFSALHLDRLEHVSAKRGNATAYDAQAWWGRDFDRLVIKAEGEHARGRFQEARSEVLWSHALAPYWDMQSGLRYDSGGQQNRTWLALGLQGLAPYWFDVEATLYLGNEGRSALRASAEYDLLLSRRLVLQPRVELNAYGKDDPAREVGRGVADTTWGLRLRYEFTRQFAPYLGVERAARWGHSANLSEAEGNPRQETRWVAGLRFWF